MFATISRSFDVAKMSFRAMRADPEMLLFPLIASILSLLTGLAFIVPSVMVAMAESATGSMAFGIMEFLLLFVMYFALAFFSTFSQVCVVFTAATRFSGGDATFKESIQFAIKRLGPILGWSLLSASVGVLLSSLDRASRKGGIAGMVLGAIVSMVGFAWAVVSVFVVPAMVFDNVGPIEGLKRSTATLKQTWGETLTGHIGLGFIRFLAFLPAILLFIVAGASVATSGMLATALFGMAGLYLVAVHLVLGTAEAVYRTALFQFARGGATPGFAPDVLRASVY